MKSSTAARVTALVTEMMNHLLKISSVTTAKAQALMSNKLIKMVKESKLIMDYLIQILPK